MGILSKLFHKEENDDKVEFLEDKEKLTDDVINQSKSKKETNKNTEPSPFLVDNENVKE